MIEINGRQYPLWSQFVEQKEKWIGGVLEDHDMGVCTKTVITDITLEPNGKDSAYFSVKGEEFTCAFDVKHGGITAGDEGWLTFSGYGEHIWRIMKIKTLELKIAKLQLSPGDCLVIKLPKDCSNNLSSWFYREIERLKKILPDNVHILLLENGVELNVVSKNKEITMRYKIIHAVEMGNIKLSLNIRLDKKESEDVLTKIANELRKNQIKKYKRIFIYYYLPKMIVNAGVWATSHFDPNLEIKILGCQGSGE